MAIAMFLLNTVKAAHSSKQLSRRIVELCVESEFEITVYRRRLPYQGVLARPSQPLDGLSLASSLWPAAASHTALQRCPWVELGEPTGTPSGAPLPICSTMRRRLHGVNLAAAHVWGRVGTSGPTGFLQHATGR